MAPDGTGPALDSPLGLWQSLARAGGEEELRTALLDGLREAEARAPDPRSFREQIRSPVITALLDDGATHRVTLANGLILEVGLDSPIERSLLLSPCARPNHVWEPQTTKLLVALAERGGSAVVGGAYVGDHALFLARTLAGRGEEVHAFEPMESAFRRLLRNVELSGITNLFGHRSALWDTSGVTLRVDGPPALASTRVEAGAFDGGESVSSTTIDDHVASQGLTSVGTVMLDTEGGEARALQGAEGLLSRPFPDAPNCVFEVHGRWVDFSRGLEETDVVRFLTDRGYHVLAIRDVHGNLPMTDKPIEVIPADQVYLEGPPHGFNMLATKDSSLISRLGLKVVSGVSPKLLVDREPALHHPLDGF